jgi:hypothetical protein
MRKNITSVQMIQNRVAKGHNPGESTRLLATLIRAHGTKGPNIAKALTYNGFATEGQARKFAKVD